MILPYKVNVFLVPNLVIIKSYQFHTCACAHSHSIMLTLCDTLDCLDIKLLCAWDSSGKNTGVGYHFPPPGDLPDSRDQTVSPVSCISHRLLSSLAGDSPWAHKELDIPEGLTMFHFHFQHYQERLDPRMQIKVR